MMNEYERLISKAVRDEVADAVYAGVKTYITNDELYVGIYKKECNIIFETVIPYISQKVVNGVTSSYFAYEVIKKYRAYVTRYFFK